MNTGFLIFQKTNYWIVFVFEFNSKVVKNPLKVSITDASKRWGDWRKLSPHGKNLVFVGEDDTIYKIYKILIRN